VKGAKVSSPQHQQLAESLLAQISEGQLAVGDRLPTEMELGESSGLARGTVRRALRHLEELGMISRRPGAGTIVIAPAPVERYQPVAQSAADIANLTADTKIVRPDIREIIADNALSSRIGVKKGTPWFLVQGVRVHRSGDDTPLCWSEHYLRGDTSRTDFLRGVFTEQEVSRTIFDQTIYADTLSEQFAEALDAEPGGPALVILRRARDKAGKLVSVGIHTHPGARYRISTKL
jgi:GntR family transcriptional regulator